ncbi:hypothetical protein ACN42_g11952 [Penicillium freii]|uniref:Uncharacterized protein n=1 Tax=Penicillium freii TaxID=48697 RepID=A0A101M7D9_PENFR|nr:hypothetical protein ACN42_g11952 [Penicillium freii]
MSKPSWHPFFCLSVIYYGIAIVKNIAPKSPQPHSTHMLGPILIPYNDAPIKSYNLYRANLLGLPEAPIIKTLYTN